MKTKSRIGLLIFIIGLALIVASLDIPAINEQVSNQVQPQTYFFQQNNAAIVVTNANGTVRLIVAPVNSNLQELQPIVNLTVVGKEEISFTISSRGFYSIGFYALNGSETAVSYTVAESGIPNDLILSGSAICVLGLVFVAVYYYRKKNTVGFFIRQKH